MLSGVSPGQRVNERFANAANGLRTLLSRACMVKGGETPPQRPAPSSSPGGLQPCPLVRLRAVAGTSGSSEVRGSWSVSWCASMCHLSNSSRIISYTRSGGGASPCHLSNRTRSRASCSGPIPPMTSRFPRIAADQRRPRSRNTGHDDHYRQPGTGPFPPPPEGSGSRNWWLFVPFW